jgi:hypothetical protein
MKPSIIEQLGFYWLELPRESVLPLSLVEKDKSNLFNRLRKKIFSVNDDVSVLSDSLFDLFPFKGNGKIPAVGPEQSTSFFDGYDVFDMEANANATTANYMPLIDTATMDLKLKKAKKLLYKFEDVKQLQINSVILLEEYINISKPVTNSPGYLKKLRNNELFIVTEVLQTNSFSVQDASDYIFDTATNVKSINEYLSLKAKLNIAEEHQNRIQFKREKSVTFAVKLSKIIFNSSKDNYTLSKTPVRSVKGDSKLDFEYFNFDESP